MKFFAYSIPLFMITPPALWVFVQLVLIEGQASNWLSGNLWEVGFGITGIFVTGIFVARMLLRSMNGKTKA